MESSWRIQVNEFGLNNGWGSESGITGLTFGGLVARDLTSSDPRTYLMQSNSPNWFLYVIDLGGDLGWVCNGYDSVPSIHPHFPYGRPVPPDSPP